MWKEPDGLDCMSLYGNKTTVNMNGGNFSLVKGGYHSKCQISRCLGFTTISSFSFLFTKNIRINYVLHLFKFGETSKIGYEVSNFFILRHKVLKLH